MNNGGGYKQALRSTDPLRGYRIFSVEAADHDRPEETTHLRKKKFSGIEGRVDGSCHKGRKEIILNCTVSEVVRRSKLSETERKICSWSEKKIKDIDLNSTGGRPSIFVKVQGDSN